MPPGDQGTSNAAANAEQADGKSQGTRHDASRSKPESGSVLLVSHPQDFTAVSDADLLALVFDHPDPDIMADPV